MQTITNNKSLSEAILHLEGVKKSEETLLKQHFQYTVDSLNPINIVKEKFNETIHAPGFKGMIFKNLFKLGSGIFSANLAGGLLSGSFKGLLSSAVQNKVLSYVDNPEEIHDIKEKGLSFLTKSLQKLKIK